MAASAPEKQQIDIDPEGDLILKVGGKDETQSEQNDNNGEDGATREDRGNDTTASLRLLRVCSKIMTLSSPVFKSMLEPGRFLEGSLALNKAHPPHLALPDDEPVAMTMLCRIIHYKQEPQDPTVFESLSGLAVLSDKYGCVSAIQPWFTYCLHQKLSNPSGIDIDDLPHLLSAAHFFDDCSAFYGLTMTAVRFLPRNTEMREAFEAALYPGIAGKLTATLETIRQTRLEDLINHFHGAIYHLYAKCSCGMSPRAWFDDRDHRTHEIRGSCKGQASRIGNLIPALAAFGLWRHDCLPDYALSYAHDIAQSIAQTCEFDNMNAGTSLKLCKGQCESCNIDWKSILMEGIERCEQKIAGICLVCFKKGHSSDSLTDKCAGHCDTYPASTWSLDTERFWENGDGYA